METDIRTMPSRQAASLCQRLPLPVYILAILHENRDPVWVRVQKQSICSALRAADDDEVTLHMDIVDGFFLHTAL